VHTETTGGYPRNADLYAALGEAIELRPRLEATSLRAPSAKEFYASLRTRSPELPESPRGLMETGPAGVDIAFDAKAPWSDSCREWIDVAITCYQTALAEEAAGSSEPAMFHWAEGAYAVMQASACLRLGF